MSNIALYYTIDLKIAITFLFNKCIFLDTFLMPFRAPKKFLYGFKKKNTTTVHEKRSQRCEIFNNIYNIYIL